MFDRRYLRLFVFAVVLVGSSMLCDTRPVETLEQIENEDMTRVAEEVNSINLTGTAGAGPAVTATSPPTATATSAPPTPTPTLVPTEAFFSIANPPPPVAVFTDPAGDAVICTDGSSVDDAAVDIVSLAVYDPAAMNVDLDGWLLQVTLGRPADETFANDWSGAVLSAYALTRTISATVTYTFTLNQVHDGNTTTGVLDQSTGEVFPGTENTTFIDENGFVWFEVPRNIGYLQISAFHLPSSDMSFDERRCDVAPDTEVYTLQLSNE